MTRRDIEVCAIALLLIVLFPLVVGDDYLLHLLILTAFLDWQEKFIYDPIIYSGVILGFLFNLNQPLSSLLGILVGAGSLSLLRLLGFLWKKKEMLGTGDVFFGAMIGSLLGWRNSLLAIFLGALLALILALFLIQFKVWRKDEYIPFGTFLSLSTGLVFFFGEELLSLYLRLFSF